jgi:hypothetical protein
VPFYVSSGYRMLEDVEEHLETGVVLKFVKMEKEFE